MAGRKLPPDVIAVLGLGALLVHLALLIGDAVVGAFTTLVVFLFVVYSMFRLPIRSSLIGLMFVILVVPNPSDCTPAEWTAPYYFVGAVLINHLNAVNRDWAWTSPLSFSLNDVCYLMLLLVALSRRMGRSRIDTEGALATPRPLFKLAYLALGAIAFTMLSGLARGGEFRMALWQMKAALHVPILFCLFSIGLRGPKDFVTLGKVILVAGVYKAITAVYISKFISGPIDPVTRIAEPLPYATSHQDSVLFATAFVLVVVMVIERAHKNARKIALFTLPILAWGISANNRRMAWVQVGLVLFTMYLIARESPIKRRIRRTVYALIPFVAVYARIGWNRADKAIFKPVKILRSVVDTKTDGSTFWRELENYDLIMTFRQNWLFGTGYGHGYVEYIKLPDVPYELERYLPHNSILGLWCYYGYLGFTALTLLWTACLYFAMRSYHSTTDPQLRTAALVAFAGVLTYIVQCWGDLGLGTATGVYIAGSSLAVAGKLASATGAWKRSANGKAGRVRSSVNPERAHAA